MSLDLRILDIPGINAVNEAEQAQVARVAERYVATADLILLVGRADDLLPSSQQARWLRWETGCCSPTAIGWCSPIRSRLPASRPGSARTSERFSRAKLYQELGTHDYKPPKSVEGCCTHWSSATHCEAWAQRLSIIKRPLH